MIPCALFLEMDAENPVKGYPLDAVVSPADVPSKYICAICSHVVRQAVQLPQLADPKIVCNACHEQSVM